MSSWFRWGRGSSGAAKGAPAAEKKKEGEAKSEVISFESIPGTFRDPDLELLIEEVRQLPVIDKKVLNQLFHTGLAFDKSLPTDALSHADQEYPLFMSKAHAHLVSGDLKELSNVAHYFKNFMCLFGAVRVSQFCLNVHHYCVLLDYTGKKEIAKESAINSIARTMQVISEEYIIARNEFAPLIPEALRIKEKTDVSTALRNKPST